MPAMLEEQGAPIKRAYMVGLKGSPVTVFLDDEGKESFSRPMHDVYRVPQPHGVDELTAEEAEEQGFTAAELKKFRKRRRPTSGYAQLRGEVAISAYSPADACAKFRSSFGITDCKESNWTVRLADDQPEEAEDLEEI